MNTGRKDEFGRDQVTNSIGQTSAFIMPDSTVRRQPKQAKNGNKIDRIFIEMGRSLGWKVQRNGSGKMFAA